MIQVKSTAQKVTTLRLNKRQVEQIRSQGVNLMVVFWHAPHDPFVVVVPPVLFNMLSSGAGKSPDAPIIIKDDGGASVKFITFGPSGVRIRNKRTDLSRMVNRFDRLAAADDDPYSFPDYAEWSEDGVGVVHIVS